MKLVVLSGVAGFTLCWLWRALAAKPRKQTYMDHLDRVDYYCQQCGKKQQHASDLVRIQSPDCDSVINVCHEHLPNYFDEDSSDADRSEAQP